MALEAQKLNSKLTMKKLQTKSAVYSHNLKTSRRNIKSIKRQWKNSRKCESTAQKL